jgi:hypothetical protein
MFISLINLLLSLILIFNNLFSLFIEFAHVLSWLTVLILLSLNGCFMYVIASGKTLKDYMLFSVEHKWLKPNTLFIPFELNICLCNYFMLKASVLGYGFDLRIKWRDVVSETIDKIDSKETDTKVEPSTQSKQIKTKII